MCDIDPNLQFYKNITGNLAFSCGAYLLAIVTWTAITGNDFMSASWKPIIETRKKGIFHLFVTAVPMVYMPVYIYFQFKAEDYNEMNAALVALMFAVLHMFRTLWGLWQLQIFKQWVVSSRVCMMSLGYGMEQNGKSGDGAGPDEQTLKELMDEADAVKVNESIVDNRLTGGEVRCSFRWLSQTERVEVENSDGMTQLRKRMWYTVRSVLRIPGLLWWIVRGRSHNRSDRGPCMEPKEPVEIWLRWATVLVANCMPEWLSDMKKVRNGEMETDHPASYKNGRDRFRAELLMSAALHCGKTKKSGKEDGRNVDVEFGVDGGHSFLAFEKWANYPKLCKGTFNKREFLTRACSDGIGLPFDTPHKLVKRGQKDLAHNSYKKFSGKLNRARDDLPADIGENADGFMVEELEWLAIFLSIGRWSDGIWKKQDDDIKRDGGDDDGDLGLAVENLGSQLGFARGAQEFYNLLSGPFLRIAAVGTLWGNRQVSEHSAHIDNWMAICTGEQTADVESKMPNLKKKCTVSIVDCASEADERQASVDEVTPVSKSRFATENVWKENKDLEEKRNLLDLTNMKAEFSHFEKSVSFMGCSMENLRSALAVWVEENESVSAEIWEPEISERSGFEFAGSKDLKKLLLTIQGKEELQERFVTMRLLWELQNHMHEGLLRGGASPSKIEAIMLCILSCPAICMDINEASKKDGCQEVCAQGNDVIIIVDDERRNVAGFNFEKYELVFRTACGPQDVGVAIRFSRQCSDSAIIINAKLDVGESSVKRFCWEAWRDAFEGRMEGREIVKAESGCTLWRVSRTRRRIWCGIRDIDTSSAGTGRMKIWEGWLPTRSEICKYEISSPDFITEMRDAGLFEVKAETDNIPGIFSDFQCRISAPVSYCDAKHVSLKHASLVVVETVRGFGESGEASLTSAEQIEKDIRNRADRVAESEAKGDRLLALMLYEIAVTASGDGEALEKAIGILVGRTPTRNAAQRAVTLIENFYLTRSRRAFQGDSSLSLRKQFKDGEWVHLIENQFQRVLSQSKYEASVAVAFAKFCLLRSSFLNVDTRKKSIETLSECIVGMSQMIDAESKIDCTYALARTVDSSTEDGFSIAVTAVENVIAYIDASIKQKAALPTKNGDVTLLEDINSENSPFLIGSRGSLVKKRSRGLYELGRLWSDGTGSVRANSPRAVELYSQAIEKGDHAGAMCNLAYLLENGAEGVPANPVRSVDLYNEAIEKGDHVLAMYNLAIFLENGAEGVPANPVRSVELYNEAIEKGDHVGAMINLALLLQNGAEGVPANPVRSVELYNEAIEKGDHVGAMINLALLLQKGAEGVPANPVRSVELYNEAIEKGDHVGAMINLALLLQKGAEGVPANPVRSVELYNEAIEKGDHAGAMYNLAIFLENGAEGVPANPVRSVELYNEAIEKGNDTDAMNILAYLLENGAEGVPANLVRSVELYNEAIEKGDHVLAMIRLAYLLENGAEGVPANPVRSVELYNEAIEKGDHVLAMNNLALLLEKGAEGVPANPVRSVELYNEAIEKGEDSDAMINLALLLENGAEGVPANPVRSEELYSQAIEKGDHAGAMYNLALLLEKGAEGVPANPVRSVELYNEAIEKGDHVGAMINLALLLQKGAEGVPANPVRSVELYNEAIEKGDDSDAMNNLAYLLENGAEGVPANPVRSVDLYNEAIEKGDHVLAMNNLAYLLENGAEGVPANPVRSVELYNEAIEKGDHVLAMNNLANLLKNGAEGVPANPVRSVELYNEAIERGDDLDAMTSLAILLENGAEGVPANPVRSVELYNEAIEKGDHVGAMNNLARLAQERGLGTADNFC